MSSIAAQNVWAIVIMMASMALLRQVPRAPHGFRVISSAFQMKRLIILQQPWFVPFTGTYADGSSFPTDASAQVGYDKL